MQLPRTVRSLHRSARHLMRLLGMSLYRTLLALIRAHPQVALGLAVVETTVLATISSPLALAAVLALALYLVLDHGAQGIAGLSGVMIAAANPVVCFSAGYGALLFLRAAGG